MALNATIMGDAMDDALDALMIAAGKPGLPSEPADQVADRKRLFHAIAAGVIKHLQDNPGAFVLEVTGSGTISVRMREIT